MPGKSVLALEFRAFDSLLLDSQLPAKSYIVEDQTLPADKAATKQKEYRFQGTRLGQSRLIMVSFTTVKQELAIVRKPRK
jgi:hypothetical protein